MITKDDALVGENVRKLRGDMAQERLADIMRNYYGHAWKKQTVYNIESGQRQLKLTEARDLLAALGYDGYKDLHLLFQSSSDTQLLKNANDIVTQTNQLIEDCTALFANVQTLEEDLSKDSNTYSDAVIQEAQKALRHANLEALANRLVTILNGNAFCLDIKEQEKQLRELNGEGVD